MTTVEGQILELLKANAGSVYTVRQVSEYFGITENKARSTLYALWSQAMIRSGRDKKPTHHTSDIAFCWDS